MVIDITSIVPLLTSVSFAILLLVLLRAEKNRTNRAFSYYILANIIWSFGSFMMHLNSPIFSPLFWNRFMVSALLIIPMFYYDFACKYTLQQNKLKNLNIFAYIILEILNLSGLIVSQARFQGNSFIYEPGNLILVAYGIDYGIMVLAALTLIVSYRKEENLSRKIGLRYVLTGSFVLMAGTLANLSSALGAYPIDIFSNLINALLIAYAIFRFKFVRVRKIARKFIAYVLTMFLVILLLTAITYAVAYFLYHNTLTNSTITIKIYHIFMFVFLVTLIASFIFEPIREFLEQNIFKPPHLIEKKIKTSIERYLICDTISEFSDFYIDDLKLITNCEDAYTYFYDRAKGLFICLDSSKKGLGLSISGRSMLVEYFKKSNKPIFASYLDILPEFTGITQEERQFIELNKIGLISPLSYKGEVLGISFLKVDEGYFVEDPEILDYLDNLNSNINIVLKNLMLIENLTQVNREMEAIRGKRDLFFAKMSHDIRNYITVIVQASNMLLSEEIKEKDKKILPEIILRESDELIFLLNSLLELFQIEFKGLSLEKEYFSVEPFLSRVRETNLIRADKKHIKISLNILDKNQTIYADIKRIKEVLDNLLTNSIKFSPIGSEILLSFYKKNSNYYFSVRNSGPKIPEVSLKDIFNVYSQSDSNSYAGFGIGLSIAKEIINLHSGEIWAENLEDGVEFTFYIPSGEPNSHGNVK